MPVALYFVFRYWACLSVSNVPSVTLALLWLTLNMVSLFRFHWMCAPLGPLLEHLYLISLFSICILSFPLLRFAEVWLKAGMFYWVPTYYSVSSGEPGGAHICCLTIYSSISEQHSVNSGVCLFRISENPVPKSSFEIHSLQSCFLWWLISSPISYEIYSISICHSVV